MGTTTALNRSNLTTGEHTPGPWQITVGVTLQCGTGNFQEDLANARLIAAAPDMLAALQAVREGLELRGLLDGWVHDSEFVSRIDAAIAKAEGRSGTERFDHKYEPGSYGVCKRCGQEKHGEGRS